MLEAIAILTNWRKRGSYRCHSALTLGETQTAFEIEVRPEVNSYRSVRVRDGSTDSFDGASGERIVDNRKEAVSANQIATEPLQLRLSFPLSLGIWGRPGDSYRFDGARDLGDDIVVDLMHQHDASVTGTLTVSRQLRIAVRLDTPTVSCLYRDIEPLSDRF